MLIRAALNGLYFSGLQTALAPWTRGVGSILMLHHVRNEPERSFSPNSGLSVSPEFLDAAILRLKLEGYQFVSMDSLRVLLMDEGAEKPDRPVLAITLDDGYRDNLEYAVPIFRRHSVPYTIYIAPGLTDGRDGLWWEDLEAVIASRRQLTMNFPGNMARTFKTDTTAEKLDTYRQLMRYLTTEVSEDRQRDLICELCRQNDRDSRAHVIGEVMNWEELAKLSLDPLCTLGAHTMGHHSVARLSEERAMQEMQDSRDTLERKLGKPVLHFAYPYGHAADAGKRDFDMVRELGFETAVTTRHGVVYPQHREHLTALPRISVNGEYQSMRYVRTLTSGATTRISNKGAKLNVV